MRLTYLMKVTLLFTIFILFLTGIVIFVDDPSGGYFGTSARSLSLAIHGTLAFFFAVLFGSLIRSHIQPGWRNRLRLSTGIPLATSVIILIATSPLLYYASNDSLRAAVWYVHVVFGITLMLIFVVHGYGKRR